MDKRKSFSVGEEILSLILLSAGSILLCGCMGIHTAAEKGNVSEVRRQLAWGVNPNAKTLWTRTTPLIKAAENGHIEVVKLLLDKGADVNEYNEGGETPLHYATRGGHTEVMKILLDHGANIRAKGTGCGTPLQWAARNGQIKAAELLLARGADINQQGTDKRTALMDAAENGDADMVKLLLLRRADVNARAIYGHTALHSAAEGNNVEIGRILLEHGADPTVECNGRPISEKFLLSLQKPEQKDTKILKK